MPITVSTAWQHALAHLKLPSNTFANEEVRASNVVQSKISSFHYWHWLLRDAVNIALTAGIQDYTMAAADQNNVADIAHANLLLGTTELPPLLTRSHPQLPRHSTPARPYAVGLLSPTQLRLYPVPDTTYTLKWAYYARPAVFTSNTNVYQCPDNFTHVIFEGVLWKVLELLDDDRERQQYEKFIAELSQLRAAEIRLMRGSR